MFNTDNISLSGDYLKPGRHLVKITGITSGLTTKSSCPYMDITFESPSGSYTHSFMFKNTLQELEDANKKDPDLLKKMNSYISIRQIKDMVYRVTGAEKIPGFSTVPVFAEGIKKLLVGKEATIKLSPKSGLDGKVYTNLGSYPNIGGKDDPRITFDPKVDDIQNYAFQKKTEDIKADLTVEDLPF